MDEKIKIAIIDSGINTDNDRLCSLIDKGLYIQYEKENFIYHSDYADLNGHGTYCAEIIENLCQNVRFVIIKILNQNKQGNSKCLIEALNYLYNYHVNIINLSLATQNELYKNELQSICNKLKESGTIIVSSLANHQSISYPAVFKDVIGVKGELFLREKEYIYRPNKTIQCQGSGVPVLVEGLEGTYTFFGGNSKAAANITGILADILTYKNKQFENLNDILIAYSIQNYSYNRNIDIDTITNREINISKELINERLFKKLIEIVQYYLKIPDNKKHFIFKYSLLNSYFNIDKNNYGKLVRGMEKEWGINFKKGSVTLFSVESVEALYKLLKKALNDEDN